MNACERQRLQLSCECPQPHLFPVHELLWSSEVPGQSVRPSHQCGLATMPQAGPGQVQDHLLDQMTILAVYLHWQAACVPAHSLGRVSNEQLDIVTPQDNAGKRLDLKIRRALNNLAEKNERQMPHVCK